MNHNFNVGECLYRCQTPPCTLECKFYFLSPDSQRIFPPLFFHDLWMHGKSQLFWQSRRCLLPQLARRKVEPLKVSRSRELWSKWTLKNCAAKLKCLKKSRQSTTCGSLNETLHFTIEVAVNFNDKHIRQWTSLFSVIATWSGNWNNKKATLLLHWLCI